MNIRKGLVLVGMFAFALPVMAEDKPAATAGAEIGKPAPAFELKDTEGKTHKLSDYAGKIVVIEWMNHECPVCRRHADAKTASNTMKKFEGKPVVWLGIDSSHFCETKADSIKKFNTEKALPFPTLLDAPGKIGKAYGAKTTPHVFVIDQKGVLAYQGAIDNKPDGEGRGETKNYVEEAVNALLAGSAVPTPTTKPYGCGVKYKVEKAG